MVDLNALALAQLAHELLDGDDVAQLLAIAHSEDARDAGDITTASMIESHRPACGHLVARSGGVVAGMAVVQRYLDALGLGSALQPILSDGEACHAGQALATIECTLADLLGHERPMLNFLGLLSGIATLTREYVDAVAGTGAVICDTRKTTPGLRVMEKYAVRCGGGTLHRIGLFDAALYKDNHLVHIPSHELTQALTAAAQRVRAKHEVRFVEVEVDSLEQLEQVLAIEAGLVDLVLLDNMKLQQLREAVAMRNAAGSRVQLEASGGVRLDSVRAIAETGVQRIAVGAITHGATWLDIGLDIGSDIGAGG